LCKGTGLIPTNEAEIQRIAKENDMSEADVRRLSDAMDDARLGKLIDGKKDTPLDEQVQVRYDECPESDEVHDGGY
jgi:hypothetical protein